MVLVDQDIHTTVVVKAAGVSLAEVVSVFTQNPQTQELFKVMQHVAQAAPVLQQVDIKVLTVWAEWLLFGILGNRDKNAV
jgi:hypothetical protein